MIRRILLKVAKKLSRPYSQRVRKCLSSCFNQMTVFYDGYSISLFLKPEYFVIPLQQVDPRLPILLFQIVSDVINHPHFSNLCVVVRKNFQERDIILVVTQFITHFAYWTHFPKLRDLSRFG